MANWEWASVERGKCIYFKGWRVEIGDYLAIL